MKNTLLPGESDSGAPPASVWVRFLRSYGPTPQNLTMFDEYVSGALGRAKVQPISLSTPLLEDMVKHVEAKVPGSLLIVGTAGTAGMIRRLRANLLDELQKQYVVTARAKGLHPFRTLVKYPLRMALNFFISDIGSILPAIISGAEITAIVLSLETTGPMLIKALQSQDMYLAGSFLMFLATLTVMGVLISDIALAFLDPRIRLQGGSTK